MTTPEEWKARYLETGAEGGEGDERLDLIRRLLADPATWDEPPSSVFEWVAAEVVGDTAPVDSAPGRRWRVVATVAAALVMVVAVLGVTGVLDRDPTTAIIQAVMSGTVLAPDASGTASLEETPSGWWIRLEVEGLPPAPAGAFYQGWVWRQDRGVSIGTFHLRGGNDPVILWAGVDVADYPAIWVTLQEEGSGPAATDQVMMRGEVVGLDG